MFKKAATVAFKGETRLRGKEGKRLREAVALSFGGEEIAAAILPSKADVVVRKAGGGTNVQFVFLDGECMFVQLDGKAEIGAGELMPALPAFWKVGAAETLLPCVVIQRPVARFVFGGANLMAPGVHSVLPAVGSDSMPREGTLVVLRAIGNPAACAVGRLLMAPTSLGPGTKGEAVEVLHYFGDALWEAIGSPRPAGFVGDEIQATEAVESPEKEATAPEGSGQAEAFSPPPRTSQEAGDEAPNEPSADAVHDSPEDMKRALEECLLQAIKTRVKDKDLPLVGNSLYAQHMRPCRRAGSNIDVKASSFKKLAAFLAHAEESGWIALKKGSAEPVVTRIFRDHPDVREWKPWPKSVTAEADDDAAAAGSKSSPSASIQVEFVWKIAKLKPLLEALGDEAAECCTKADCQDVLHRYVNSKDLWLKNNRKRIGPDGLLLGFVAEKNGEDAQAAYSIESLTDSILKNLPACHRVTAPQGGAAGGVKVSIRAGKPPNVQVRTDMRRGHHVTLVHGLEAYGVDMEALAACLQKALASAATVEEASPTQPSGVMVQGFWDVAVVEWLGKVGIPSESIQHQAKKGQQQKKAKQGSNIVKH